MSGENLHPGVDRVALRHKPLVRKPGMTSSIGPTWPPDATSFRRIKGIDTRGIIRDRDTVVGMFEEAQVVYDREKETGKPLSRISVRAILDTEFLKELAELESSSPYRVEAIIPLTGTQPVFENSALVYFGVNSEERQPSEVETRQCLDNYSVAVSRPPIPPTDIIERASGRGYELQVLKGGRALAGDEDLVNQFTELYQYFGWTREDIVEILGSRAKLLGVARKGKEIISAGIAELLRIPFGSNTLRMAELTEAATHTDHRGAGLYRAVASVLLGEIAEISRKGKFLDSEIDIVFGECNGKASGVLNTAADQGRTFSRQIGELFGYPDSGILVQHIRIDGNETSRLADHNDLFPAFLNRDSLYELYPKK
jgi:hypothetical protein